MKKIIKISFVCHGNICRSPMAEFIFKKLINERGLNDCFYVDSKAVTREEEGNPVYPLAKSELKKHDVNCDGKYSVVLKSGDYENYDYFICMDDDNVRRATRIFGDDKNCKIKKLKSFYGDASDVSDPWYTNRFDVAYNDIYNGCVCLLNAVI